ncbi:MAG TPA: helix-turn-helix domain-containing protein [Anaerolineae bacterium]|nr:helix-turn-helix domain-containing protein [Anaerolineae bacterium]
MIKLDIERAQILGKLIHEAREHAGRSPKECAQVLNLSVQKYHTVESGKYPISLPELEALALYLNIPMGYFWGSEPLSVSPDVDYQTLIALRHRVIGVLLSQLRLRAHKSQEEVAEALDMDVSLIKEYEMGQTAVPYLHLEQLCRYLDSHVDLFMDDVHGPLGRHEALQKLSRQFHRLDPEMQQFLINPSNMRYLETAKKLSEMDVNKLRQIAEDLLEITY